MSACRVYKGYTSSHIPTILCTCMHIYIHVHVHACIPHRISPLLLWSEVPSHRTLQPCCQGKPPAGCSPEHSYRSKIIPITCKLYTSYWNVHTCTCNYMDVHDGICGHKHVPYTLSNNVCTCPHKSAGLICEKYISKTSTFDWKCGWFSSCGSWEPPGGLIRCSTHERDGELTHLSWGERLYYSSNHAHLPT